MQNLLVDNSQMKTKIKFLEQKLDEERLRFELELKQKTETMEQL